MHIILNSNEIVIKMLLFALNINSWEIALKECYIKYQIKVIGQNYFIKVYALNKFINFLKHNVISFYI